MTTITQTQTQLPTGTWSVDPVHSQVGFAVDYMGGTFRGSFSPVAGTLDVAEDGDAELNGSAHGREHQGAGREPRRAPALARVLRRRAHARDPLLRRPTSAATATTSPSTAS